MSDANGPPLDLGSVVESLEKALNTHAGIVHSSNGNDPVSQHIKKALTTLRSTVTPAPVQPVSTGAEFFPAVDDLTEMIDHWKENTDMDTHDLVEGVIGYFGPPVQPIRDQFNSLLFETKDVEKLAVCMRDSGYEFNYQGVWYEAKDGKVAPLGNLHISEVVQPSAVVSRKDFEREADKLGFDLDNNMRDEYLESNTKRAWKLVSALQLPQPVAPVQSGGVEYVPGAMCKKHLVYYKTRDGGGGYTVQYCPKCDEENNPFLAHLTTTQSAPVAKVVVDRKAIENAMDCIYLDGDTMGASIQGEDQAVKNILTLLAQLPGVEVKS